jgi:sterol desaturase/sphingolipid hydroxylase (fatty acid hydroxylase superfamily)
MRFTLLRARLVLNPLATDSPQAFMQGMKLIQKSRALIRAELEAAPALRRFGSGWISGVIGLVLGVGCLGLVLALRFPGVFSMAELTPMQSQPWFRAVLFTLLLFAYGSSVLSLILRESKTLGTVGMITTLLASGLGGWTATPVLQDYTRAYVGLDFFVLNVLFTGLLFVPLETIFPRLSEQPLFRTEWREDIFYYLVSSMLVQIITWLSFGPARTLFAITNWAQFREWVAALPLLLQIVVIMFLTDLVQYWLHRAFHRVPALWRFHAVHHSAKAMDWMAGARMHLLEIVVLRGATVIPMIVLGFHQTAVGIYIFTVYLWSTFIHANIGWRLRSVEKVLVTPRFHHWHHGIEEEAIDVNFAIHFPLFDRLFGTHHMPTDRWPEGYGVGGHPVPKGYLSQMLYPFRK